MQMTAEGRASENAGPAVRDLKGAFTGSPGPRQEPQREDPDPEKRRRI